MEKNFHSMTSLFKQLGLPSEPVDIQRFIEENRPVSIEIHLYDAPFWSPTQAAFLRESILIDADWAVIIDRLNAALREPHQSFSEKT